MGYQLYCELPLTTVMSDGASVALMIPSAFRSASSWKIRIALDARHYHPLHWGW